MRGGWPIAVLLKIDAKPSQRRQSAQSYLQRAEYIQEKEVGEAAHEIHLGEWQDTPVTIFLRTVL
jgi:hypothetical protein